MYIKVSRKRIGDDRKKIAQVRTQLQWGRMLDSPGLLILEPAMRERVSTYRAKNTFKVMI